MSSHQQPRPGDMISYRFSATARHYGIVVGYGEVIDNSAERGRVGAISLREFTSKSSFRIDARAPQGQAWAIVDRARGLLGRAYSLTAYNCEHFANHAFHGRPSSGQVRNAGLVIGVLAVAGLVGGLLAANSGWDPNMQQYRTRGGQFRRGPRWL